MLNVITAPSYNSIVGAISVFLAGGITGCEDWQSDIIKLITGGVSKGNHNITLYNPRRENFPIHDPAASNLQIKWEHDKLREADAILFYFSDATMCPIVLYELGAWSMTDKPIFVACHPKYQRKQDVLIQTSLVRPDVKVVDSVEALASQVVEFLTKPNEVSNG